jgi:hypothetical protein
MKLAIITLLIVVSVTPLLKAQEASGRYQLVVAQAGKDWGMPSMVFKIDTASGQTWVYQIGQVEVAEKYRSQFPKGIRADGWTPIPDSFGAEVGKALKFPEGYGTKPTPSPMP